MGYRSEVAIKCQKNAFPKFEEVYKRLGYGPDKLLTKGDEYLIYWDWIKWYEDYDIVMETNKVMSELNMICDGDSDEIYEKGFGYKFMRLGEDNSDIEEHGNCEYIELWTIRDIDLSDFEE